MSADKIIFLDGYDQEQVSSPLNRSCRCISDNMSWDVAGSALCTRSLLPILAARSSTRAVSGWRYVLSLPAAAALAFLLMLAFFAQDVNSDGVADNLNIAAGKFVRLCPLLLS
jgi:hypothetical protein